MSHRPDTLNNLEDCMAAMNEAMAEMRTLEQHVRHNPTATRNTVAAYAEQAVRASEMAQAALTDTWRIMEQEWRATYDHATALSPATIPLATAVLSPGLPPHRHHRPARQLQLRWTVGV